MDGADGVIVLSAVSHVPSEGNCFSTQYISIVKREC